MMYRRRPSAFERLIKTGLGIAQYIRDWQDQTKELESERLRGVANLLDLHQSLYPDQPMPITEKTGQTIEKAIGFQLPRLTPERVTQEQENLFQQKWAGQQAPGDITTEGGGRGTPMAEVQRREQEARGFTKSLGSVGGYAPIPSQGEKVAIVSPGGDVNVKTLEPGISEIFQVEPENEYGTWDVAKKKWIPTGNIRPMGIADNLRYIGSKK